jgi:hypothetical protein
VSIGLISTGSGGFTSTTGSSAGAGATCTEGAGGSFENTNAGAEPNDPALEGGGEGYAA